MSTSNYRLIKVDRDNRNLISDFLAEAGSALTTFRYYNNRSLDVIENHLVTYLVEVDESIVGYGHLDKEKEIVWLGIAVSEKEKGNGIGKLIMSYLLDYANEKKIKEIKLSVDSDNDAAKNLYLKFGFSHLRDSGKVSFFLKKNQ